MLEPGDLQTILGEQKSLMEMTCRQSRARTLFVGAFIRSAAHRGNRSRPPSRLTALISDDQENQLAASRSDRDRRPLSRSDARRHRTLSESLRRRRSTWNMVKEPRFAFYYWLWQIREHGKESFEKLWKGNGTDREHEAEPEKPKRGLAYGWRARELRIRGVPRSRTRTVPQK